MRRSQDRQLARAEAAIVKLRRAQDAKAPRLDPPVCWLCDRKLVRAKGGRPMGRIIVGEDGRAHPAHVDCAARHTPPLTVALTDLPEEETR